LRPKNNGSRGNILPQRKHFFNFESGVYTRMRAFFAAVAIAFGRVRAMIELK
jgi:hypothetical protein